MKLRLVLPWLMGCLLLQLSSATQGSHEEKEQWGKTRSRPRPSRRQRRQGYDAGAESDRQVPPDFDPIGYLTRSQKKPRDVLEGFTSSLQTLLLGGIVSAISLVGIPVALVGGLIAASIEGTQDFFIIENVVGPGLLGLIAGGLIGSASALGCGLYSLWRASRCFWDGVVATPVALKSWIIDGKKWNPYERKWKSREQSLEDERRELLSLLEEREAEAAKRRRAMEVADTKLYDLLDVSPAASKSMIKKAYFSKAKDIHPDKNRDDPKAHERFVELHEAYTVLSDEKKRDEYDRWGSSLGRGGNGSIHAENFPLLSFDANLIVAILFSNGSGDMSSPTVEKFVGELGIANFLDVLCKITALAQRLIFLRDQQTFNENTDMDIQEMITALAEDLIVATVDSIEIKGTMRTIEIATHLVKESELLSNHSRDHNVTAASEENFRLMVRDEAQRILRDSGFYGPTYLEIIGSSLLLELSQLWTPFRARTSYQKWYSRKEFVKTVFDLSRNLIPVVQLERTSLDDYATACLPGLLRLITVYNRMDISMALREAIWKVFNDPGASRSERKNRKRAIRIIGEEFTKLAAGEKLLEDDMVDQLKSNFVLAYKIAAKQATAYN